MFLKSWRPISSPNGADVTHALYICRRPSQEEPFGAPILIQPILPYSCDYLSLSDDGTTAYVGTYRTQYPDWPQLRQMSMIGLPQLSAVTKSPEGGLQFGLLGRAGANYDVQASTNLLSWQTILSTNTSDRVLLSDPDASKVQNRFYRALSR